MVGLLDIAPAVETVIVRGSKVPVPGVSAAGIANLLGRFPELRRMFTGNEVKVEALQEVGGALVAAIIAAGTGTPGNEEAEKVAAALSVDEQADLLEAILKATMPGGVGPFVEKLERIGAVLNRSAESPATPPATKSPKESSA
jgi:hypothetical protein